MGLDFVKTKLRELSYSDMKKLSAEVGDALGVLDPKGFASVADALVSLPLEDPSTADRDDEVLREIFRRKLNISIVPLDQGWEVFLPSQPEIRGCSPKLRDAVSQLLDILVARTALGR